MVDAKIFSLKASFSFLGLPFTDRILSSAKREIPILDDHPVTCRRATALTPLLTPRIPFSRSIWKNISIVPGTLVPSVAILVRVTSTVFMHVVIPIVR